MGSRWIRPDNPRKQKRRNRENNCENDKSFLNFHTKKYYHKIFIFEFDFVGAVGLEPTTFRPPA